MCWYFGLLQCETKGHKKIIKEIKENFHIFFLPTKSSHFWTFKVLKLESFHYPADHTILCRKAFSFLGTKIICLPIFVPHCICMSVCIYFRKYCLWRSWKKSKQWKISRISWEKMNCYLVKENFLNINEIRTCMYV